jgi:hypothetical protein
VKRTLVAVPIALVLSAVALQGAARAEAQPACGTWETMASPNAGYKANVLHAVAAVRDGKVAWAVGSMEETGPPRAPLALRMEGDKWSLEPVPMTGGQGFLLDVAISPKGHVWTVGALGDGYSRKLVAMRWRDGAWDVETTLAVDDIDPGPTAHTPLPLVSTAALYGVAAVGDDDVWVVGEELAAPMPSRAAGGGPFPTATVPVVAHWDGYTFQRYPIPASRALSHHLRAVSAVSPEDIWTVGYVEDASGSTVATIHHFDGKSWTLVPNAAAALKDSRLLDVVALGPQDAWAVGHSLEGPVYVHWDGKQWTRDPGPPSGGAALAIDGAVADDVWASSGPEYFHYDGVAWSIVSSSGAQPPALTGGGETLHGMAAYDRCSVLTVGTVADGDSLLTLTERLRPAPVTPITLIITQAGPEAVRLTWTKPDPWTAPLAVVVERCDDALETCHEGAFLGIQKFDPDVVTYYDSGLKPATYTYRIAVYRKAGVVYSAPVETTLPEAPSPVKLSAVTAARDAVRLTWTPPDQKPTHIVVERCLGTLGMCTVGMDAYVPIADLPPDTLTYVDPALKPGVFTYRVAVFNEWWTVYSDGSEATVPAPLVPVTLGGGLVAGDTVRLSWTRPKPLPEAILVERCLGPAWVCNDESYVAIAKLSPDAVTYDDPALKPGLYTYRVTTFDRWWMVHSDPVGIVVSEPEVAAGPRRFRPLRRR